LAHGKYPVLVAGSADEVNPFIRNGAPIAIVPTEDSRTLSPSSGIVSLINRAPHPNAAKLFLNWILTKEGQTIMTTTIGLASRRTDVPTAHLLPEVVPQPGKKYIEYTEESTTGAEEAQKLAKEIFGPLLK
jgi:iron(III) transport system substrate-binding protein